VGVGRNVKRGNRYVHGHNSTGKSISLEVRVKTSASLVGRPRPKEVIDKVRIGMLKAYAEGRICPRKNNNGVSGVYKGVYFDSTCELCFLMQSMLFSNLIRADRGDKYCQFTILYIDKNGIRRSYHPDYFDEISKTVYEIKPIGYRWKDALYPDWEEKEDAAYEFCGKNGWIYCVKQMPKLSMNKVVYPLRFEGTVSSLEDKYENKYNEWLMNRGY
jgi:hypothetical protein